MKKMSVIVGLALTALLVTGASFATDGTSSPGTIGDLAATATGSAKGIIGLILALCYIIGLALVIAAIVKLKAHKDAPTQVPISTGIVWLFLGSALLFLPTLIGVVGKTVFGGGTSPTMVDYTGSINLGSSPNTGAGSGKTS